MMDDALSCNKKLVKYVEQLKAELAKEDRPIPRPEDGFDDGFNPRNN